MFEEYLEATKKKQKVLRFLSTEDEMLAGIYIFSYEGIRYRFNLDSETVEIEQNGIYVPFTRLMNKIKSEHLNMYDDFTYIVQKLFAPMVVGIEIKLPPAIIKKKYVRRKKEMKYDKSFKGNDLLMSYLSNSHAMTQTELKKFIKENKDSIDPTMPTSIMKNDDAVNVFTQVLTMGKTDIAELFLNLYSRDIMNSKNKKLKATPASILIYELSSDKHDRKYRDQLMKSLKWLKKQKADFEIEDKFGVSATIALKRARIVL